MTTYLFSNNAQATLASGISSSATTCTLATGTGAIFPSPTTGQAFTLTFTDAISGANTEICLCTNRTADVLTIIRGQEGTTAQAWQAGDIASNYFTAGSAAKFAQTGVLTPAVTSVTSAFYTQTTSDVTLIVDAAFPVVLTLLDPATYYANSLVIKNVQGYSITSDAGNVVPTGSTSAGLAILDGVVGTSCTLQSDGTNWVVINSSIQPSGF